MKYKTGICEACHDDKIKPLISKQCSFHYRISMHKRSLAREKERADRDGVDLPLQKIAMNQWYLTQMASPKICENCEKDLHSLSETDWRGSQHHILEKSIFHSVKLNLLNHLVLGRWCCHPIVTNDPEKITEMRCFEKAKARVQAIKHQIVFGEIRRIPYYFED